MPEYQPFATNTRAEHGIVRGYFDCAEWVGLQDDDREALELAVRPHWSDAALQTARETVQSFVDLCLDAELGDPYQDAYHDHEQIGHDLYLTQNRHGAGFWDGDYSDHGTELTSIAHSLGSQEVDFDPVTEELGLP